MNTLRIECPGCSNTFSTWSEMVCHLVAAHPGVIHFINVFHKAKCRCCGQEFSDGPIMEQVIAHLREHNVQGAEGLKRHQVMAALERLG